LGPDARTFNPNRWLGENAKTLDQHMASFSKGSCSCIGQNLANAEVTLVLAYLLRNYDLNFSEDSSTADEVDSFTSQNKQPGIGKS
jgi:cytochrome P450